MLAMLKETIETIPAEPGSYLLWLQLRQMQVLKVGRLGRFNFPSGDYIYLGSAQGPGGLRARLGRHLLGSGKPHWHIDHLRAATQVRGFGYQIRLLESGSATHLPVECDWSQKLATLSEVNLPVPDFGASDCRSGCSAHLVHIPAGGQQKLNAITDHFHVCLRIMQV
jgi:Uri superfamily endonuclease